jgi:multiple sugar transport system substrate-binding protein
MKKLALISILLLCFLLGGCQSKEKLQDKKEVTILYSSIADFKRDYGFVIDKFKDTDIKIVEFSPQLGSGLWNAMNYVPDSNKNWDAEKYVKLVKDTKPDIVFFPQSIYQELINQNLLTDLSPFINNSDLLKINSDIVEAMREMGAGKLYALSDSISSQAIFYNKDVFKRLGIPDPTDHMSWEDVINLAGRFSSQTDLTGLYLPYYDAADLLLAMGRTEGLKWYDSMHNKVLFNSPSWRRIVEKELTLYRDNLTHSQDGNLSDLFLDGKVAMTLNTYQFITILNNSSKKTNWDIVTEPIDPKYPQVRRTVSFQYLNGIIASKNNFNNSLEVWNYINSEEVARLKNNLSISMFTMPVRESLISNADNRNLAAFYALKPEFSSASNTVPRSKERAALLEINNIMQQAIDNPLTVDQIIESLQEEINNVLQEKSQ